MKRDVLIKKLYQNRYGITELANMFQLTKQRIHQIINDYKNTGKKNREEKYKRLSKLCALCGKPRKVLHHIDKNNKNDTITNLLPLCRKCYLL